MKKSISLADSLTFCNLYLHLSTFRFYRLCLSCCNSGLFFWWWVVLSAEGTVLAQRQIFELYELQIIVIEHYPACLQRLLFNQEQPVQKVGGHQFPANSTNNYTRPACRVVILWQKRDVLIFQNFLGDYVKDLRVESSSVIEAYEARRPSLGVKVYCHRHSERSAHYKRNFQLQACCTYSCIEFISPIDAIVYKSRSLKKIHHSVPVCQCISVEDFNLSFPCIVKRCIFKGRFHFGFANVCMSIEKLSVQIMNIDDVVVDKEELSHSQSQQIDGNYRSQSPHSQNQYCLLLQFVLVPIVNPYLPVEGPSQVSHIQIWTVSHHFDYQQFISTRANSIINGATIALSQISDSIIQIKLSMKLKNPSRPNYSRYAKLCDQTFYHDSTPVQYAPTAYEPLPQKNHPTTQSTYGFTSVPREKKGNFRFPNRLPYGQFTHYPNHLYGRNKSPSWSFPKKQKYGKEQFVQYELCHKSPLLQESEDFKMRASVTSFKEGIKEKVKSMRSTNFMSTKDPLNHQEKELRTTKNYSIINPRQTSSVSFFNSTKIHKPRYVSKEDLNQIESNIDQNNYQRRAQPRIKGYIQFYQRRPRHPNRNSKGFQTVLYPYEHQKQFNNYQLTKHPTHPEGHIDMTQHMDRPDYTPDKLGPNTTPFPIDYTRTSSNKINLLLQTFRDRITTRYDRVGPEPNTQLDYDPRGPQLGGLVQMDRDIGRSPQLFPIVDPAIKKAGDREMTNQLRKNIPLKQINEALRPKNVQNFAKMIADGI